MAKVDVALFMSAFVGGGLERTHITLAEVFAAWGLRVDVVVMKNEGELAQELSDKVRVIELGTSTFRIASRRGRISVQQALHTYISRERPYGIIAGDRYCNVCALMARGPTVGPRVVIVTHNMLSKQMQVSRYRSRLLFKWLVRYYYRLADVVVSVSAGVADDLAREAWLHRKRMKVVFNPVVTPEIVVKAAESVDHPWFLESRGLPPLVLAAGRLTAQKDFATLLRAFALVRAERSARLMVLGEGPDRVALEALARTLQIERDVAFPGFVANPFSYMARASVFVLSSAWEGFGNVLVEAMACGCPVVSTECPSGPSEILDNGRYGQLVSVGAPDAMAAAIGRVLDEPPDKEVLLRRASAFSAERSAARYLELLGLRDANPR